MTSLLEDFARLDKRTSKLVNILKRGIPKDNECAHIKFRYYLSLFHNLQKRASEEKDSDAYYKINDKLRMYKVYLVIYFKDVISFPSVFPPRVSKSA